ncbi:patatin-like protein [Actinocrispum wychmicini]|uniref:patatin-like protein n=1 Tax=Actinocrispum wychmicini TaxID=1213861 RepID=UPI00140527F4|nr:patatin-like protein [Actinocrispum wychmicini]
MADDLTQEEVRFAVVLNGGVSLAVWMGGVVLELDRLTRRTGAYEHLLGLVGASARADVISGTSAGGINGAALALAQVNPRADLSNLRELWAEQGRMDLLLRTPFKGAPVSLLKGDEFFLPRLEDAMRRLTARYEPSEAADRPIDLRVTTTLLQGRTKTTTDALGQRLTQRIHQGIFQFTRQGRDDFRTEDGGLPPDLTRQLALAARSSASFPVAFEPSFVGVGEDSTIRHIASWWEDGVDHSQFAVDGGVLVNTPTKEALDAIDKMPAEGPTRRVMLLVFPHATASADPPAQTSAAQPSVLDTVRSIMRAQSSQSNRTFVDEIEKYNRGAAARRGGRNALLKSLRGGEPLPRRLYELVETLYPHYTDIRLRRAARKLAERQVVARAKLHQDDNGAAWSFERIRDAVELAHQDWLDKNGSLPYAPKDCPPNGVDQLAAPGSEGWPWDLSTGERLAASVLDMLKRVVWVMPNDAALHQVYEARRKVHSARARLRTLREAMHAEWEADMMVSPDTHCWSDRLARYDREMKGTEGNLVRGYILDIARAFDTGAAALSTADRSMLLRDPSLEAWQELASQADDDPDATLPQPFRSLSRLLALEVATTCLADDSESPEEQQVELAQISLQTENAFARYSVDPDDKAGGYSLSRFSGFLKRSWRANDWTWGRMDAASMLCRVLLDPARVRRSADLAGLLPAGTLTEEERAEAARTLASKVVGELVTKLFGDTPTDKDIVACRDNAIDELTFAYAAEPGSALPATCPYLAELVAWSLHIQVVLQELPEVRRAVLADGVDGASTRSNSARFVKQYASLVDQIEHLPAGQELSAHTVDIGLKALQAFDRAGIGREPLGEEAASDQMIRTAASAAATAITVVDSDKLGVKAARPVTRSLRGLVLLPYWTILGLTRGGQLARFLGQFGLAAGGLLLVLAVLGALPDWAETPGAAVGAGAVLAAFGYSALRTGSMLHGLVLLSPGVTMVTYGATEATKATGRGMAGLVGIVLFVAALLLIGSLPGATLTPMGGLAKLKRNFVPWVKAKHWLGPLAGLAIIAACVGIVLSGVLAFLNHNQALVVGVAAGIVVASGVFSYFSGRTLRTWQQEPGKDTWTDPPTQDPAASAATWAVVYGGCYVAAAIGLSFVAPETPFSGAWWSVAPWWAKAAMATAIAFAAVLLLVVPWYVPWRARAEVRHKLINEAGPAVYKKDDRASLATVEAKLCQRLTTQGMVNRHLARCPASGGAFALTPAGRRVAKAIRAKTSA